MLLQFILWGKSNSLFYTNYTLITFSCYNTIIVPSCVKIQVPEIFKIPCGTSTLTLEFHEGKLNSSHSSNHIRVQRLTLVSNRNPCEIYFT